MNGFKISDRDDEIMKRIESAEDKEREMFDIIVEYGLSPEDIMELQKELEQREQEQRATR